MLVGRTCQLKPHVAPVAVEGCRGDGGEKKGSSAIESLLHAWKKTTEAARTMDPVILADGVSEQKRAAIINEGRAAISSLQTALGYLDAS